ncbi:tandem-95 repeat protein [Curtobacterium sp. VKM Ac-2865]|uniref:beta strand repeat-containing protein n=1 Tax=Curtobacterium sp. VKM Ac-2865 TaxID=2783817 RepID=UPI00188C04FE|nr:Ig-like domain-containing protein [Curtobacterium sp. VKM Ac-2865]MBF4582923.1 tandem-95 repeat protein [Curtobacterium sp. VKM Ac-2865]
MLSASKRPAVPRRRAGVRPLAVLVAALLVGTGLSTATAVVAATPASAVSATTDGHFVCDQNTLYAVNSAGKVVAVDLTTGDTKGQTVDVADLGTGANNGLGVSREGKSLFAASNNRTATLRSFDPATNTASDPVATDKVRPVIRGAVNPVTGIYYYGDNTGWLGAYDPATKQYLGQVGQINGLKDGNGDFAFSSQGLMFVVAADKVYRVNTETVPTTSGTTALATTPIATLPSGTNSPGIAFSSDGYLYVSNSATTNNVATTTLYQLDPTAGTQVRNFPIVGNYNASDLATCNYADTVTGKASIDERWAAGDQFGLAISGDGITSSSTGTSDTTTGSDTGVQARKAGAILTTPGKNYTVTQTAAGTTDPANYATTWKAIDLGSGRTVADGTGTTASFTFPQAVSSDGTDVVVTFANTMNATHVSTSPDTATTAVGTTLSVPASAGVLGNDSGTGLSVVSNTTPAHGSATVAADGSWTYTPADGFSGTDAFDYTAKDSSGRTATSTVTVTVKPNAAADAVTVHAGSTAKAAAGDGLLANDAGKGLTITDHTDPAHGVLDLRADGSYTYTPAAGWSGPDTFTYTATDDSGATTTATVTVTVLPTAGADTVTATAGQPTVGAAPGLLADDLGHDVRVSGSTQPAHGTVAVQPDGSYTYTPATGFSGTDTFTYTVTDGTGSDTVTVTVHVAPKAVADIVDVAAGGSAVTTDRATGLLGNDLGDGLSVTAHTTPAHGSLELDGATGTYTYTPAAGFSGTDTFDYTVVDRAGTPATATVTVVVRPTAKDDSATTTANVPVTVDVQRNDLGTGLVTTIVTGPTSGTAVIAEDGSVDYAPTTGSSGTDTFTYRVTDGAGRSSGTATATITVVPRALPDTATTTADQPVSMATSALTRNDVGTGVTVTGVRDAQHGTVTLGTDGTVLFTPTAGFSGTATFHYDAVDTAGGTTTSWVVVVVGPQATADTATATAGSTLTVSASTGLLANDQGTGLTATIDEEPLHGTVDVHADGSYTYTPKDGWSGPDAFTYTATDAEGNTSTGIVRVTVQPSTVKDSITTAAGQPVTVTSRDLTANDHGTGLTVTAVGPATSPATVGTVVRNADGTVTYTPAPGTSGTDTFTYVVTGANGNTATGTVTVTITPVVAAADTSATADGTLVVPADQGVLAGSTGTDLTVTGATKPAHGDVDVAEDGSYTYTPTPGYSGPDTFDVTVTDGTGTTTTGTVTITVAPKALADTATTTASTPVDVRVTKNDSGTALTVTAVGTPGHGTASISGTGTVTYVPATGFSGTDTFTYTVTDPTKGTATATVTVTVTPTAVADTLRTPAGTALTIAGTTLTRNDLGTGLRVTGHGKAAHGTVTAGPDGSLVYTPRARFSGTDTFTYTATDASGRPTTTTVTVLVGAVAVDDWSTTKTNGVVRMPAAKGVLSDDAGTGLWASMETKPQHGRLRLAKDGSYVYSPAANWSGRDWFTYAAHDAAGATAFARVAIDVVPTAGHDTARTTAGTPVQVKGPGVLGNDRGSALRVVALGRAAHGTVTVAADGTFRYAPAAGFSGVDTVTYTAQDASGQRADTTVTVTVGIAAAGDHGSTIAGTALPVDARHGLLRNDLGTGLTAALRGTAAHGAVRVRADGSYVYTPAAGFTGTDTFTYTVTDASGQTTTATATITVVAHAVATDDRVVGTQGRPVTIAPIGNDSATGGARFQTGSLRLVDPADGAHVTRVTVDGQGVWVVRDGKVVFTPEADRPGTVQMPYTVTDTDGQAVTATITVVYPVGLAAAAHAAQLAFTGATGLVGMGLAALAALLAGAALLLRRRQPTYGPLRRG